LGVAAVMRVIPPPYFVSRFIAIMCTRRRPARDEVFAGLAFVTSALSIAGASAAAAVVRVWFFVIKRDLQCVPWCLLAFRDGISWSGAFSRQSSSSPSRLLGLLWLAG
jgi:hypothetical protein